MSIKPSTGLLKQICREGQSGSADQNFGKEVKLWTHSPRWKKENGLWKWEKLRSTKRENIMTASVGNRVGEGGIGLVYDLNGLPGDALVVKAIAPKMRWFPDIGKYFDFEALALEQLYPVTPKIAYVGEATLVQPTKSKIQSCVEETVPVIAMEKISGTTFAKIDYTQLHTLDIVMLIIAAAVALEKVHDAGFVYTDIKHENFMFSMERAIQGMPPVVLVDFSFSGCVLVEGMRDRVSGTPEFIASEVIARKGHDFKTDQYSLGLIGYSMLARQYQRAVFPEHSNLDPGRVVPPFSQFAKFQIPKWLEDIIMKAVSYNPSERFESVRAFREALESTLDRLPEDTVARDSMIVLG